MGRKRVTRQLPDLAALVGTRARFGPADSHTDKLREVLRDVIQHVRRAEPHPFYSMREVAAVFHVPVPTVALVYRRLTAEGLLMSLRGSMTLVQPAQVQSRYPVRGVVGLPVWLPGFLRLEDWRVFFIRFEERLRANHFVADFLFYKQSEEFTPEFLDRLLAHRLDHVIWFTPDRGVAGLREMLRDHGVRFVAIDHSAVPFPGAAFRLSWARAFRKGLQAWRQAGIHQIIVPRAENSAGNINREFAAAAARAGVATRTVISPGDDLERHVRDLREDSAAGVYFDDDLWSAHLCRQAPQAMAQLFRAKRVMLSRQVVLPGVGPVTADMSYMDWDEVGRRVVADLTRRAVGDPATPTVFEADWRPASDITGAG